MTSSRFGFVTGLLAADKLEDGAFCHFTNPDTNAPLYLPGPTLEGGKPDPALAVGAYVRSTSSKVYEDHLDRVTRRAISSNRKAKNDTVRQEIVFKQLKEERPETFAVVIAAFLNTSIENPGKWVPSHEESVAIASDPHNRFVVEQVIEFCGEASNFVSDDGTDKPGNAVAA